MCRAKQDGGARYQVVDDAMQVRFAIASTRRARSVVRWDTGSCVSSTSPSGPSSTGR